MVAQLLSPTNDVTNALSGNLHALLDGVADKAAALNYRKVGLILILDYRIITDRIFHPNFQNL